MKALLLTGFGGFLGAILRYALSFLHTSSKGSFPTGTFIANILGCFFLSYLLFFLETKGIVSKEIQLFLGTGLLGAFTTMSTFSFESIHFLSEKQFALFFFYIISTLLLCIGASLVGRYLGSLQST